MCSIFGFIVRGSSSPDLKTLGNIVRANIVRGPHSFGFSWIDGDAGWKGGRLHCYRQNGRLTDQMGALSMKIGRASCRERV